jgi:hypothetical protein
MTTLATLLGITSGFILMGAHRDPATLIATSLVIDASLAPLTTLIASRHGRSVRLWSIAGFVFGAWAFGAILLLGRRREASAPSEYPPTSDAA